MEEDKELREAYQEAQNAFAEKFDYDWDEVLRHECEPWQREAMELAFKMGFFEGLGYAATEMKRSVDD